MGMDKPKLIIHTRASIDGRIATISDMPFNDEKWDVLPKGRKEISRWILNFHKVNAILDGSGSFVPNSYGTIEYSQSGLEADLLLTHHLPLDIIEQAEMRWYCVIDSRGRIKWNVKKWPVDDGHDWTLLVLVTESTPLHYLAFLRDQNIPYLVVGRRLVDLEYAMSELLNVIEIESIVSKAGGTLNGALLSANLIDEVDIEFIPAIIGGDSVPVMFSSNPLAKHDWPVKLKLLSSQTMKDGNLWVRYSIDGYYKP